MAIKSKDILGAGWPSSWAIPVAVEAAQSARRDGATKADILATLERVQAQPEEFVADPVYGAAAKALIDWRSALPEATAGLRDEPVPYAVWGEAGLEEACLDQMRMACRLDVSVRGAQMPDGHVGYGLPIGGVLATRDAVVPYAVGVDIGCRMKISIVAVPADRIDGIRDKLRRVLMDETVFGTGAGFDRRRKRDHAVLADPLWNEVEPEIRALREKAESQLGSSGSGNHFVEWGEVKIERADLGLEPGRWIALLSHSGSRGFGAMIANRYTKIAMAGSRLPQEAKRLAWLDLSTHEGQAYWAAMNLAGNYASANHDLIHRHVLAAAGMKAAAQVENHHNFAWREEHGGESLIVHRKGATPAGPGVLGMIPGSMADPGFIVRGLGAAESLNSAAHGAGRRLSRKKATETITRSRMQALLRERGVELISGGVDEAPLAYKDIREVMAAQADLVEIVAEFHPRIVRMAADGGSDD